MMKILPVLVLSLILLFPVLYANASPIAAELVIENIQTDPPYPQIDELASITTDVCSARVLETSSLSIYSIPTDLTSGMLIKITDKNHHFNFEDHSFEFAIFQDSYDTLFKKILPLSTLLDANDFWVSLPSGHNYFAEVYLDGRSLFLIPNMSLQNNILVNELTVLDYAKIQ